MRKIHFSKEAFYWCLFFFIITSCNYSRKDPAPTSSNIDPNSTIESLYRNGLNDCIENLEKIKSSSNPSEVQSFYLQARIAFKKIEPILAFEEKENYKAINQPNILKVDEEDLTDIKIREPFGIQVIEELLQDEEPDFEKLQNVCSQTINRLLLISKNTHIKLKSYHILWLIRDQIIRIATTGITGFDSPIQQYCLNDARTAYQSIAIILNACSNLFNDQQLLSDWLTELQQTNKDLNTNFIDFNRFGFIKNHTHKQLELWVKTSHDWNVTFPFEMALSNQATSLFSESTFNLDFFISYKKEAVFSEEKAQLGKELFNDKRLSAHERMSCASCHLKELAFTDGLKTFPKQKRNTPTLTYASLQNAFFYDGRAGSLEGQIVRVVDNPDEFHSDLEKFTQTVQQDTTYLKKFELLYRNGATNENIRNSIASYIRSLNKFNSRFDQAINGADSLLNEKEIDGFNLFMGKAKCATCHFPPVFNGTVPPAFVDSEFELIGVPQNTTKNPTISEDLGRYYLFHTNEKKHFFKTPTIRNVSLTTPYMHNGVYSSLEEVMEFYNNGGGNGLGFQMEMQTLPFDSLNLSNKEIDAIIAFMKSLEDEF